MKARWKDDSDHRGGEPRVTRKVLTWYRLRLRAILSAAAVTQKWGEPAPADLEGIIEACVSTHERFLVWRPAEEYAGPGYSAGGWHVLADAVVRVFGPALQAIHASTVERARIRKLHPAPGAPIPEPDVDAALEELAQPDGPVEAYAYWLLGDDARRRLGRSHERLQFRTPRPCSCCGEPFTGKLLPQHHRKPEAGPVCDACKVANRRRCVGCREVFTVAHGKQKRCEPCLKRAEVES